MFKNYVNLLFLSILFLAFVTSSSYADRRSYVWNYEYQILEKGETELENYMTVTAPNMDTLKGKTTTTLQLEYEIGMTEHFDFAVYQVFKQKPGQSLAYDGYKLRARYKFGKKGDFFVDPLLYFEYVGKPDFSEHEFELKLILSKDIGDLNIVFNPQIEFAKEDVDWETVFGYTLGARYTVSELMSIGVEALGNDHGNFIGPSISHGNEKAWISLGTLFNAGPVLNNGSGFQLRMLMGFAL